MRPNVRRSKDNDNIIVLQDSVGSGVIQRVMALPPGVEPLCILAAHFP